MLNYYFTYIDAFVIQKIKLKPDLMINGSVAIVPTPLNMNEFRKIN